jgi:uncharacterized protein (DUF1800 family)
MPSDWTEQHVRRLFWRAGFGATPDEAARWAGAGRDATIRWIVDGGNGAELVGPEPRVDGKPIDPLNVWGHDVLWWLDRMVRSQRPLVEKMTIFWHDHFATREQETPLMLAQNRMLRQRGLGDFKGLLRAVTTDPAMQLFLSLADSDKSAPNENYARELMELFTLGKGYTEHDIREAARALTGFQSRWTRSGDFRGIRWRREAHDAGVKRIFRKKGRFGWRDVTDLVCAHGSHAPFLVAKLWAFFVTAPLDPGTQRGLVATYKHSGHRIKPVVEAILRHPALYAELDRPDMVKSPLVFLAGALRLAGGGVQIDDWAWLLGQMGQYPFSPPSVAGWDWGPAWLSTNTIHARFQAITYLMRDGGPLAVADKSQPVHVAPADALASARRATGRPCTSPETDAALERLAEKLFDDIPAGKPRDWRWQTRADMRERILRHFLLSGPDAHLH